MSRVNRKDQQANLPFLEFYFEEVVRRMERRPTKQDRKVSRRLLLETFMRTRSVGQTAKVCGVSDSLVGQIVAKAIYTAMRMAGVRP